MPFTLDSLSFFFGLLGLISLISIPVLFILGESLNGLLELVRAIGFVFRLTGAVFCLLWSIVRALVRPFAVVRPRVLITGSVAGDLFGGLCALVFFGSVPAMFICMFTGFPQGATAAAVLLMLSSIILSLMALRRRRQAAAKAVASQGMLAPDLRDSTKL